MSFQGTDVRFTTVPVKAWSDQGFNARKVISEVYASFVPQCTVIGR